MRVWRLTRRIHSALDGEGARLFGGRWSLPGVPVVYASATASLAALEYLVHVTVQQAPDDLVLIAIDLPDGLVVEGVTPEGLPPGWRGYPGPAVLAEIGSAWAIELRSPVMSVPSAVVPHESNYLINPRHPEFEGVKASPAEPFALDPRVLPPRSRRRSRNGSARRPAFPAARRPTFGARLGRSPRL